MTDGDEPRERRTKLYGAIDVPEHYPPTIADSTVIPAVTAPIPGGQLAHYRIDDVLGRGGMGEVLSANDERIGRSVAIKRLRIENPTPEIAARFVREAQIQGRLEHPAVVPVHEVNQDDPRAPFFVMKQLAGTTLAEVLPRLAVGERAAEEQFGRMTLLRAFVDVCLAIEFAHTRGIVHRDLKPANIVLGDFGEVYVLDWGIARVAGEAAAFTDIDPAGATTAPGIILGTPGYISPEQIRGDADLDGRADVYSLGCILFEILAHTPLHPRGHAAMASALGGLADARPSVRARHLDPPPELDAVCLGATAVDPADRIATARQLATAVQRFLDGSRDLTLRKELARAELEAAHQALATGTSTEARRDAIRAAARALALDPTDRAPADLVGHLMIEPPLEVPPEVDKELERIDYGAMVTSARFGMVAAIAIFIFFPVLYWVGLRELWYHVLGSCLCFFVIFVEAFVARRNAYLSGYLTLLGNLALFSLLSWMISPMAFGPAPAIIMVMLTAQQRTLIRPWLCALLATLATLGPLVLGVLGIIDGQIDTAGPDVIGHTVAGSLDPTATNIAIALYIAVVINLSAQLARMQDDDRRTVRRAMQLQAWQLRQLVPRPQSGPVAGTVSG